MCIYHDGCFGFLDLHSYQYFFFFLGSNNKKKIMIGMKVSHVKVLSQAFLLFLLLLAVDAIQRSRREGSSILYPEPSKYGSKQDNVAELMASGNFPMLPEVPSALVYKDDDFADDDNIIGQKRLRKGRYWGR